MWRYPRFLVSPWPLCDLDFGLRDDPAPGGRTERRKLRPRDAPAAVEQGAGEWRTARHVADQTNSRWIDVLCDARPLAFLSSEDRFQDDIPSEHAAAAGVDIAHRGADLRIAVEGDVFHEEIDQASVALQECEHLNRAVGLVTGRRRRWGRSGDRRAGAFEGRGQPVLEENREKRRDRQLQSSPDTAHRTLHLMIVP